MQNNIFERLERLEKEGYGKAIDNLKKDIKSYQQEIIELLVIVEKAEKLNISLSKFYYNAGLSLNDGHCLLFTSNDDNETHYIIDIYGEIGIYLLKKTFYDKADSLAQQFKTRCVKADQSLGIIDLKELCWLKNFGNAFEKLKSEIYEYLDKEIYSLELLTEISWWRICYQIMPILYKNRLKQINNDV